MHPVVLHPVVLQQATGPCNRLLAPATGYWLHTRYSDTGLYDSTIDRGLYDSWSLLVDLYRAQGVCLTVGVLVC
jgi:hypothetical protein